MTITYYVHRARDGSLYRIEKEDKHHVEHPLMEDLHLMNTIWMMERHAEQYADFMQGTITDDELANGYAIAAALEGEMAQEFCLTAVAHYQENGLSREEAIERYYHETYYDVYKHEAVKRGLL